jgi:hypothetical protein
MQTGVGLRWKIILTIACSAALKELPTRDVLMKGPEEAEVIFFMPFVAAHVGLQLLDGAATDIIFYDLVSLVLSDRLIDDISHGFGPKAIFIGDFVHILDEVIVEDRGGDDDGSKRERSKGRDCNGSNIGWGFFPVHVFDSAGFEGSLGVKFFGNIPPC